MSLNWDATKIANRPDAKDEKNQPWWNVTDVLVWGTMTVCLDEISKKNVDEWLWRLAWLSFVCGKSLASCDGQPWNPNRKDLEERIGLVTNATSLTRKQFIERQVRMLCLKANRHADDVVKVTK